MVTCAPVFHLLGVALSAETIGLFKGNQATISQMEHVPVLPIMTIEAPTALVRVIENNGVMKIHYTRILVDFVVGEVAFRAREDTLRKGRRGDGDKFFLSAFCGNGILCLLGWTAGQKHHSDREAKKQATYSG